MNDFSHLSPDWQDCIEQFLTNYIEAASGSKASEASYRSTLRRFFSQPGKQPDAYTRGDVEAFLRSPSTSRRNTGKPVSPATVNSRISHLASFYRYASIFEVNGDPLYQKALITQGMKRLRPARVYRAISEEELARFWSAIPDTPVKGIRDRAIFLFFLVSARRRSEIARLRYGDIERTTIIDNGKPRAGYVYHFRGKGKSREQDIAELPQFVYDAIDKYLEVSGRKATITPDSPLFTSTHFNQGYKQKLTEEPCLNVDFLNRTFREYCRKAGLSESYSLHCLRHSSAKIRYSQGEDLLSIMRTLRHSSLDVTYRYVQSLVSSADSGASLLEQALPFLKQ